MSIVSQICISLNSGDEMQNVNSIEVIANKGIVNDRFFKNDNNKDIQLTLIESENIPVTRVADYTGFPEILDGRVKTLNPKIHGGILARRDKQSHLDDLNKQNISTIDFNHSIFTSFIYSHFSSLSKFII